MKNDHQANKTIPIGIPMFEDVSFKFVAIDMGYIYIYIHVIVNIVYYTSRRLLIIITR